ncbi:MAG TPA: PhnD/SsuA/transferrin family substrate-binding protein [Gemmataceae bacterium]|nr:PhnD/SsuA/transferrin family substrate-binding protein [Gemmataceae bacterium]
MSHTPNRREALAAFTLPLLPAVAASDDKPAPANALTLVVLDPLAAELACSCVKGYAQRDYEQLGTYIASKIGRPVEVHFAESIAGALVKKTKGKADLIIGKDAVVKATAPEQKIAVTYLAALTGTDGKSTQTGLICVAGTDKALTVSDLGEHRVLFGPAPSEEKHAAALAVFKDLGVKVPEKVETCPTCTDGAKQVVAAGKAGEKLAVVISSYAKPLLEGCGTIKKGDLRVVGETDEVPFIAAFATAAMPAGEVTVVKAALLAVGANKELCAALETKTGFVEPPAKKK